ncbi:unnamed protein product [Rotaria sordida]|uniref:Uncharacterized protein n=1 Tax=Rotaria sordida TaxID=392033 RepID=A0A815MMV1_9BILA|nr:unnamed protein product [Rotaria sordida]
MPNKGQSTKVINADEIAQKLEVVYGIDPGSIYISTIAINNGETNADDHHQPHRKKRDIPTCNQLGSHRSIVEMNIDIVYPEATDSSLSSLWRSLRAATKFTKQD